MHKRFLETKMIDRLMCKTCDEDSLDVIMAAYSTVTFALAFDPMKAIMICRLSFRNFSAAKCEYLSLRLVVSYKCGRFLFF